MALNHDFVNNNSGEHVNQAADFLKAIFNHQAGGFLEIRAFPSDKDEPIQNFFSIPPESDKAASFATKLKSQVFYGAAPRARRKGGRRTAELYRDLLKEFGRSGGRPRRPNLLDTGEEHPDRERGSGRP